MENKLDLVRQEAEKGNVVAQYNYAKLLLSGKGAKKDEEAGKSYLKKASDKGFLKARYELVLTEYSSVYCDSSINEEERKKLIDEKFPKILEIADAGLVEAQILVGNSYIISDEVRFIDLGIKYLKMASDQGSPIADFGMAIALEMKKYKDPTDSTTEYPLFYLVKSAEAGYLDAQQKLAISLLLGTDFIKKNEKEAVRWLSIVADREKTNAQIELAEIYYEGEIVEMDLEKSFNYLTKASKNNSKKAKELLQKLF